MFDVIVVGARCAGAATAMLLGRRGLRVLLLDGDRFPSDQTASTHLLWQGGAAKLASWGLLDHLVDTGCPGQRDCRLDLGDFALCGHPTTNGFCEAAYAPRRIILDRILVEAAVEAGVEFRDEAPVMSLLDDGDRVCGVRCRGSTGDPVDIRAALVIGADGTNSRVAREVAAATDFRHPPLQRTFFSYFANLPLTAMEFYARPGRMLFAWRTHDDLTVAGICCRADQSKALRSDIGAAFYGELEGLAPDFGARVRAARREAPWRGGSSRNFARAAAGRGWALIGDAGLTMDPITAWGITNAFRDAEFLADAVAEGLVGGGELASALMCYERRRNEASLPLLEFTCEMAKLDPSPPDAADLFTALRSDPDGTNDYFGVFAQTVSLETFFAPDNIARIVGRASGPERQPGRTQDWPVGRPAAA